MNRVIYLLRFVFGFGVFGLLSLLFVCILPLIWTMVGFSRKKLALIVQSLVHYTFRFVFVYLRLIGFLDLKIIDRSSGLRANLIVANHISMFDMVAVLATFKRCNTFVNRKFLKNPLLYPIIKAAGYIPVDPDDPYDLLSASMRAMEMVNRGATFLVFPEGTRSKSGKMSPFHPGLFRIAGKTENVYQPLVITCDRPIFNRTGPMHWNQETVNFHVHLMEPKKLPDPGVPKKMLLSYVADTEKEYQSWMKADWVLAYNKLTV